VVLTLVILLNQGECPGSQEGRCTSGGQGPGTFSTGFGGHTVTNPSTGEQTISGGSGHLGGHHITNTLNGGLTCVGKVCF
jgi:hypothetical protein